MQTPSPLGAGYPSLMVAYIYDAEGRRVAKGRITFWSCNLSSNGFVVQTSYILDQAGNQITELDQDENWVHTNVYVEGTLLATFANDNLGVHFHIDDWLGSRRVQTNYAGVVEQTFQHLPFGEPVQQVNPDLGATEQHFTGKEYDSESGLNYFGARYLSTSAGRWMNPDPSELAFADPANPQSFNLYGYVSNNPLNAIDPDGLQSDCTRDEKVPCGATPPEPPGPAPAPAPAPPAPAPGGGGRNGNGSNDPNDPDNRAEQGLINQANQDAIGGQLLAQNDAPEKPGSNRNVQWAGGKFSPANNLINRSPDAYSLNL